MQGQDAMSILPLHFFCDIANYYLNLLFKNQNQVNYA
jgi:hypothetical protein